MKSRLLLGMVLVLVAAAAVHWGTGDGECLSFSTITKITASR